MGASDPNGLRDKCWPKGETSHSWVLHVNKEKGWNTQLPMTHMRTKWLGCIRHKSEHIRSPWLPRRIIYNILVPDVFNVPSPRRPQSPSRHPDGWSMNPPLEPPLMSAHKTNERLPFGKVRLIWKTGFNYMFCEVSRPQAITFAGSNYVCQTKLVCSLCIVRKIISGFLIKVVYLEYTSLTLWKLL